MTKIQILCDFCGIEKKETNGWFVLSALEDTTVQRRERYFAEGISQPLRNLHIEKTDHRESKVIGIKNYDICGEQCLLKFVSEKLKLL